MKMKLICPVFNVAAAALMCLFSVLQIRRAKKRSLYYAMQGGVRNAALLVGALFGLCTGAKDLILMSALLNGSVLLLDGIADLLFSRKEQAVMHFLLTLLSLIGLILFLNAD